MQYRLCLALGVLSPQRLMQDLTWEEWCGWQDYDAQEPWGETRADWRQAALASWLIADWAQEYHAQITWPYFPTLMNADQRREEVDTLMARKAALQATLRRKLDLANGNSGTTDSGAGR